MPRKQTDRCSVEEKWHEPDGREDSFCAIAKGGLSVIVSDECPSIAEHLRISVRTSGRLPGRWR
jgi:hypothetical protein